MFELVLTLARRRELRTGAAMRRSLLIYFFSDEQATRGLPKINTCKPFGFRSQGKSLNYYSFFFLHSVRLHNTSGGIHKTQ